MILVSYLRNYTDAEKLLVLIRYTLLLIIDFYLSIHLSIIFRPFEDPPFYRWGV